MVSDKKWEENRKKWRNQAYTPNNLDWMTKARYKGKRWSERSPIQDNIPPWTRFLKNKDNTFKNVFVRELEGETPKVFLNAKNVYILEEETNSTVPEEKRFYADIDWGYEDEYKLSTGYSKPVLTETRLLIFFNGGEITKGWNSWDAITIRLEDIEELFVTESQNDSSKSGFQIHVYDLIYYFDNHCRHPIDFIIDRTSLNGPYSVEGAIHPDENFRSDPPRVRFDYGWGKQQREWDTEKAKEDLRAMEAMEESKDAHESAQEYSPPVDIGEKVRMGILELKPHHTGRRDGMGKVDGFVVFVRNLPKNVEINDVVEAKIMHFNEDETSATASFLRKNQ